MSQRARAASSGSGADVNNNNTEEKEKEKEKGGKERHVMSKTLERAYGNIKEGMTEAQKGYALQKEAKILMETNDFHAAIEVYSHAIDCNAVVNFFTQRASCYKALAKWTDAYFDYCFAVRLEPDVSSHLAQRAMVLVRIHKLDLALEDLSYACELDPSPNNLLMRGSLNNDMGHYDDALLDMYRVLPIGGAPAAAGSAQDFESKVLMKRALILFNCLRLDEAKEDLAKVLFRDPNNLPARLLLSRAQKCNGELQLAEESINYVILVDPKEASYFIERGDVYFRTGDVNKIADGIMDFDKAVVILTEAKVKYDVALAKSEQTKLATSEKASPNKRHSSVSGAHAAGAGHSLLQTFNLDDWQQNFADVHFKRAQARLMLEHEQLHHAKKALDDLDVAVQLFSRNEEYRLAQTVCFLRLRQLTEALKSVDDILAINPSNERALFHRAYCLRLDGDPKVAIKTLTEIINVHNEEKFQEDIKSAKMLNGIPMYRVYEMRGTLLHELRAYKYALSDLGRSLALNHDSSENYYLRADCHSKLGNYEQALSDFIKAEHHGFVDKGALLSGRGSVLRMLGQSRRAERDFAAVLAVRKEKHKEVASRATIAEEVGDILEGEDVDDMNDYFVTVRLMSLQAMCFVDMSKFKEAFRVLAKTRDILRKAEEDFEEMEAQGRNPDDVEMAYNSHKRLEWTVVYHQAQCLYSLRRWDDSIALLNICLDRDRGFAPDSNALGAVLFYCGVAQVIQQNFEEAERILDDCLQQAWVSRELHLMMATFARAKARQGRGDHTAALVDFEVAYALSPNDPYILFRRAWSWKGLGDLSKAAGDFEAAKQLAPDDPNFALDYKKISKFAYMSLDQETDFRHPFISLLPVPTAEQRAIDRSHGPSGASYGDEEGDTGQELREESSFFALDTSPSARRKAKSTQKYSPVRMGGKSRMANMLGQAQTWAKKKGDDDNEE